MNRTLLFGRFALRERQASKGQILILMLLVLVGLLVIFGLLFTASIRVRATPILQEAFWLVGNQRVSTARLGENVEAHVVIKATEEYVGSIVVKIRKDIALWLDSNYLISTIPVNLKGGEEKEMKITFMPDEASTGSLRGYFVDIDFRVTRTTWVMENSYPPRLKVTD